MLNEKIKKYLKFGIIVFCCIIVLFGFVYAQDVIDLLTISEKDIVLNNYVKWESPLMVCDYKDYYQPKTIEHKQTLSSVLEIKKGYVVNLGVEVLQTTNWNETKYVEEQWIPNYIWDEESKSNVTIWDVIKGHNETIEYTDTKWVNNVTSFKPKTLYHIRQCFSRNNVLDNFEIDVSIPFMNFDMKQYTVITSSGYNETSILNISQIVFYQTFDNTNTTGATAIDYFNRYNGTIVGATTNVTGKIGQAYDFEYTENDYVNMGDNDAFSFGNDTPFTFCMFIKPESLSYNYGTPVAKNDAAQKYEYGVTFATSYIYNQVYTINSTVGFKQARSSIPFSVGNWNHFCSIYSGSKTFSGLKRIINGSFETINTDTSGGTYTGMVNTLSKLFIGAQQNNLGSQYTYDGLIDDLFLLKTNISKGVASLLNNTDRKFIDSIYGEYNSSLKFNTVQFSFSGVGCNSTSINISRNYTSFDALKNDTHHTFPTKDYGFYIRVDTTKCLAIWMNVSLVDSCSCPINSNWNIIEDCIIISDCDIRPYNLSCIANSTLNITNGALIRFNSTLNQGLNCSIVIKDTGLLGG